MRRRFRQRRCRVIPHRFAEDGLRNRLDREVQERGECQRAKRRARHRPGRLADFAARHERDLDADEREKKQDRGLPDRTRRWSRQPAPGINRRQPQARRNQHDERQELRDSHYLNDTAARPDPAYIDPGQPGDGHSDDGDSRRALIRGRPQDGQRADERRRHRRDAERRRGPIQGAREKTDKRAESGLRVRVEAAGHRDPAAGRGDAGHDERHRDRANEIRKRGSRPESGCSCCGENEDAGSDCRVDEDGCQPADTDRAHQIGFGARRLGSQRQSALMPSL